MFQIRKIKPEDIDFVIDITSKNEFSGEKLLSNIESFLICENNGEKCGCGCMILHNGKGYISWVAVEEPHRRQKFGDAIIRALLNIADLKGIEEVYAVDICGKFLESMGFEKQSGGSVSDEIKKVIGLKDDPDYFKVFLKGYFKSCPQKV